MVDLIWKPYGIETPESEYRFCPERKFRFDFAWPDKKIACEQEGGIWLRGRSGHSSGVGIRRDMEKSNLALRLGWRVFRFTPQEIKKGEAQAFMKEVLK